MLDYTLPRRHQCDRSGFTLLELMITILIILIMAGMVATGMVSVRENARQLRTQQFVMRLSSQVIPRYHAFRSRPLPVDPFDTLPEIAAINVSDNMTDRDRTLQSQRMRLAWFKLWGMRELMRMELPESYADLTFEPIWLRNKDATDSANPVGAAYVPSLKRMYLDQIMLTRRSATESQPDAIRRVQGYSQDRSDWYTPAECLYLIVESSISDRDLYNVCFADTDVADIDNDGMFEFVDGWGNPIYFQRWPAGFVSDLQPMFRYRLTDIVTGTLDVTYKSVYGEQQPRDPNDQDFIFSRFPVVPTGDQRNISIAGGFHDGFDPYFVDRWEPSTGNIFKADGAAEFPDASAYVPPSLGNNAQNKNWGLPERSYNVTPLIVSAGSDGILGVAMLTLDADDVDTTPNPAVNPYSSFTNPYYFYRETVTEYNAAGAAGIQKLVQRGQPTYGGDDDNIHNHRAAAATGL